MADLLLTYGTVTDGGGNRTFLTPSSANDDSVTTSARRNSFAYAAGTYQSILKGDLGATYDIGTVTIRGGFCGSTSPSVETSATTFTLDGSADGTAWSSIAVTTTLDDSGFDGLTTLAPTGAPSYRYVRIVHTITLASGFAFSNYLHVKTWAVGDTVVAATTPEPGYWMDWARDGFDDGSGGTASADDPRLVRGLPQSMAVGTAFGGDNVTAYVQSSSWYRGGAYDHVGSSGPGGFTIMLDNSTGRFDPDNTASDLYGLLTPGVPVWAGAIAATGAVGTANGTGTVAGFLAGYVREFVPTVDSSGKRVCQVIGEDAFGRYQTSVVSVVPSLDRSHAEFRGLILDEAGETAERRDLDVETGQLPFSAVESGDALSILEELNRATATRHFIRPSDSKEDWYNYVSVNKLHKLQDVEDAALTGDDITNISGWRVTNDNVIEVQRAQVEPIGLTSNEAVAWDYSDTPFIVTQSKGRRIIAEFDDYVFDAELDYNATTGTASTSFTAAGKRANIAIWAASSTPLTVGQLRILGRRVTRGDTQLVVAGTDTPGARAGQTISSDYIGQTGAAQGLVDFIVWKYANPLKRPSIQVYAKNAATFSFVFDRDLFDVVTIDVSKLSIGTARRAEIIGLRGSHQPGRNGNGIWEVTYELQETPNQSPVDWFDVDSDDVNSSTVIAPF